MSLPICAWVGWGGPRSWVGQPLIISTPVRTWQTELVSQAGPTTVGAGLIASLLTSIPHIHRFGRDTVNRVSAEVSDVILRGVLINVGKRLNDA